MRKKQLFALLMAGALSVGMAPTATFAADTAAETSAEGELEGELDSADTEEPSEDPAETPEEPAEDPAETPEDPAETPAETTADPTEAPAAEETDEQAAEAGSAIVVDGNSYSTLAEAFEAVPESADMTDEAKYVKVKGDIEISATVDVPSNKNIMLVAAEDATIKRAAGFIGSMFTVNGGNLQMAGSAEDAATGAVDSTLIVDGTGEGVTGSIVEVISGNYALSDGATLTGNTTTGNGGAVNNAAGANVYLQNGTITANSAAAGGAIYSEGTVNIQGTLSVTGNTVTNSFEAISNLVLAKDGVINVSGAVTGSAIGVAVQEASAGRTVVKLDDAVTDVKLTDVLSQITYEGDSSLKIGEDGTLVSTTEPSPTPTPAEEKLKVTGKECKWSGSGTVKIKFQSNVKGTYYIDWVKRGEKAPTIDTSRVGAPIEADTNVTAKVTDLPDYDVDIYVCVISDKDKSNYGSVMFQPDSKRTSCYTYTISYSGSTRCKRECCTGI